MSISEEISRLGELHQRGTLSDDEFARAKARVIDEATPASPPGVAAINRLRRSLTDRWLGGVCGGLAEATGLAVWIWRLMFALLALCGGTGVLMYLLLWIFVPTEHGLPNGGNGQLNPGSRG
jgi:phage shock protein PspC (stress-responsive transcriptional regulator)